MQGGGKDKGSKRSNGLRLMRRRESARAFRHDRVKRRSSMVPLRRVRRRSTRRRGRCRRSSSSNDFRRRGSGGRHDGHARSHWRVRQRVDRVDPGAIEGYRVRSDAHRKVSSGRSDGHPSQVGDPLFFRQAAEVRNGAAGDGDAQGDGELFLPIGFALFDCAFALEAGDRTAGQDVARSQLRLDVGCALEKEHQRPLERAHTETQRDPRLIISGWFFSLSSCLNLRCVSATISLLSATLSSFHCVHTDTSAAARRLTRAASRASKRLRACSSLRSRLRRRVST